MASRPSWSSRRSDGARGGQDGRAPCVRALIATLLLALAVGGALVAVDDVFPAADLLFGHGRVLGPALAARVERNGEEEAGARVFATARSASGEPTGQLVVYIPQASYPEVLCVDLHGRDFGRTVSATPRDHLLVGGRYLVQSGEGRSWEPFSYMSTVRVTWQGRRLMAEAVSEALPPTERAAFSLVVELQR